MLSRCKNTLTIFLLLLVGLTGRPLTAGDAVGNSSPAETRPNVIVFLVDDMGLMDTSVPMLTDAQSRPQRHPLNEWFRTPNMERLAKQGIRFSHFYAHSVCSPTRVSIMTGQNAARHRSTNFIGLSNTRGKFGPQRWNYQGLHSSDITLPRVLQRAGYRTIHIGKAHFGPKGSPGADPRNLGFDVNIGGANFGAPGSYYGADGFGHIKGNRPRAVPHLEKYHGQDIFLTEALTREAISQIDKSLDDKKPFYLYMSHYAVHSPFQNDPRFVANYKRAGHSAREIAYATLIEGMDKSLGDLLDHLGAKGIA